MAKLACYSNVSFFSLPEASLPRWALRNDEWGHLMALWFLWANERHTSMDMSAYRLRSMSSLSSALHPHVDLVNDLAKWTGVLPSNCSNNRGLTDIRKKQRLLTAVLLNTSKRYHLSEQQCLFGWGTYTHAEATCKHKKSRKKSHFYAFLFNWTYFSWILKRG